MEKFKNIIEIVMLGLLAIAIMWATFAVGKDWPKKGNDAGKK